MKTLFLTFIIVTSLFNINKAIASEELEFTAYDLYQLMTRDDQIELLRHLHADNLGVGTLLDTKITLTEKEVSEELESEVQATENTNEEINLVDYSVNYTATRLPMARHLFYTGVLGGYLFHYGVFQRYVFYNNLRKRPNFEMEISASFRKYLTKFEFVFAKHLWNSGVTVGATVSVLRYNITAIESFEPLYFPVVGVHIGYQYRFKLSRRDYWGRLMVGVSGGAGIGFMSKDRGFIMLDATGKIGILLN